MMREFLKWLGIFVLCLILQTTIVNVISISGVRPDLLILALFLLSIKRGVIPGIYAGFFTGLAQDLYAPSLLGQHALAKTIIGYAMGHFNEKIMRIGPLIRVGVLGAAFILHDCIFLIAQGMTDSFSITLLMTELFSETLPRALYTAVFMGIAYAWEHFVKPSS